MSSSRLPVDSSACWNSSLAFALASPSAICTRLCALISPSPDVSIGRKIMSAVMNHFKDMIFLPIETSGEGEINAHSRVQMAPGEAKAKAKLEFQQALESTGRRLDDIQDYVAHHPELRRPFYKFPHTKGVTGTAANFVLHVSSLMSRRRAA